MNAGRLVRTLVAAVVGLALGAASAAGYPEKPVQYVIPFAAGGESDIAARLQQQVYRRKFGQEVVVESKPGAGGGLAWSQLNQFPGDGYTIMGTNLPHIVLQPLEGNVQYQTDDITNVIFFNYTPDAIVVRNESPFRTYQDFIKAAKAKPGTLNLAGSGTNSANHAAHARLNAAAGIKTTYVRSTDTNLMARIAIERRAQQHSWDIVQTTAVSKLPQDFLQPFDPPQAAGIIAEGRDPRRRGYGVYANYNTPAYNTRFVQASELPKSYEEFAERKQWTGKVAIARGLMKNPDLLVFNEVTSGLDPATELRVVRAVLAWAKGRTVLWTLSRAELAREFDRVLVFVDGQLAEEGRFDELERGGKALAQLVA